VAGFNSLGPEQGGAVVISYNYCKQVRWAATVFIARLSGRGSSDELYASLTSQDNSSAKRIS